MRIAIVLHGILQRSITHTITSFRKNLVGELSKYGEVDIYYHSWDISKVYSPHASELDVAVDSSLIKKYLPAAHGIIEPQDEYDNSINYQDYVDTNPVASFVKKPDVAKTIFYNYKRSLESQQRAWKSFEKHQKDYDVVIATRLDMKFTQKVRVPKLTNDQIGIPDFRKLGGVNDRFAIGSPQVIKIWSNKVGYADHWLKTAHQGNSEGLLKSWLDTNDIEIVDLPFTFQRIRATGKVAVPDLIAYNYTMYKLFEKPYEFIGPYISDIKKRLSD